MVLLAIYKYCFPDVSVDEGDERCQETCGSSGIPAALDVRRYLPHPHRPRGHLHSYRAVLLETDGSPDSSKDKAFPVSTFNWVYKADTIISIMSSGFSLFKSDLAKRFALVEDLSSICVAVYDFENSDFTNKKSVLLNLYYLIESVVSFLGSFIAYRLRIGAFLVKDIFKGINHSIHLIEYTQKGSKCLEGTKVLYNCFKIAKDVLCIVGLFFRSMKITCVILSLSCLIGVAKSFHHIKEGEYLECVDSVLGSIVDERDLYDFTTEKRSYRYITSPLVA